MEFQIIRNVIIVIIVVRYPEFQMARDLRIFNKHFAHAARDLDTRNYFRHSHCAFLHRYFRDEIRSSIFHIYTQIAILREKK